MVHASEPNPVELLIVAAPAVELSGVVMTNSGTGVSAARVSVPLYKELLAACPVPFDTTVTPDIHCETDALGRFSLPHAPGIVGSFLNASAPGFRSRYVKLDGRGDSNLVVIVEADEQATHDIEGIVLYPNGTPAEDARLRLWNLSASTDARGNFRLERPNWLPDNAALVASHEGFQSALRPDFAEFVKSATDYELRSLVLILGPEALMIDGRVVDTRGDELAGWVVSIVDGTAIADQRTPRLFAEQLAASERPSITDSNGRFRITGLFPRAYTLLAYDPKRLQSVRGGPFEAGRRDVVLSANLDFVFPRLAGHVESRNGSPVAGAKISLGFVTAQEPGGRRQWIPGASTITDEKGRFALTDVPRAGVHLDVSANDIIPESFELDRTSSPETLTLSVAARCQFRVVPDVPPPPASWIEILDGTGMHLEMYEFEANIWSSSPREAIEAQGSGVLAVSEDARTLRVLTGSDSDPKVLVELTLTFVPHRVTEVNVKLPTANR
jgi:protocatechuate 3,4-dioxygenase beta subunit